MLEVWERAADGWGRRAADVRAMGTPVAAWMIERVELQPGQRVLELAAGPGDTGFLAAERIEPGGTLVCSDAADAMLEVARGRAQELGIENVEFRRLELEWIDLPAASIDAILCRWGLMLSVDPGAALREARRVLRPGGRIALAVWDSAESNPWATIPTGALVSLGHVAPPQPGTPGMFALAEPGALAGLLESAGFVEVVVKSLAIERTHATLEEYVEQTLDLSWPFAEVFNGLSEEQQADVRREIASRAQPFVTGHGSVRLPGRSLVAAAGA